MLSIARATRRSIAGQVKLKQEAEKLMRKVQWFFLACTLLIAFVFLFRLTCDLKKYFSLQGQALAKISQWELEEIGDRWAIRALYSIQIEGKSWENSTLFASPRPVNEETAIQELQQMARLEWKASYCFSNPSLSSLEKVFPLNLLIRTVVVCLVLLYFVLFKKWMSNKLLID
jgi:hypothetical protein